MPAMGGAHGMEAPPETVRRARLAPGRGARAMRRSSALGLAESRQRHELPEERARRVQPVVHVVERQGVSPVIVVATRMFVSVAPAPRKFGPPESP